MKVGLMLDPEMQMIIWVGCWVDF